MALATLAKIQKLEPAAIIATSTLSTLCWFGGLWDAAKEVMPACEKAVEQAPDDSSVHQARGLAQALTGQVAGAIEDFTMYLEWVPAHEQSEADIHLRQQWLEALTAQRNPFDTATLQRLRSQ